MTSNLMALVRGSEGFFAVEPPERSEEERLRRR